MFRQNTVTTLEKLLILLITWKKKEGILWLMSK